MFNVCCSGGARNTPRCMAKSASLLVSCETSVMLSYMEKKDLWGHASEVEKSGFLVAPPFHVPLGVS